MSWPYEGLPSYQERVSTFTDLHGLRAGAEARLLDLMSEVGEVAKDALKATRYGEEPSHVRDEWHEELADVFFSLISLANATGVNLDTALEAALAKYQDRLGRRGDAGSGR